MQLCSQELDDDFAVLLVVVTFDTLVTLFEDPFFGLEDLLLFVPLLPEELLEDLVLDFKLRC